MINKSLQELSEIFIRSNKSYLCSYKKNREIGLYKGGRPCLFYIASGMISVYDESNSVLLFSANSPFIVGLEQLFLLDRKQTIKFELDAKVWVIEKEDAIYVIDLHAAWFHVSFLIGSMTGLFLERYFLSISPNVYGIVKSHLEYLWKLPEVQRLNLSVISFILKRNKISRSSVYRIIRDLNDGGYIKTIRGKLYEVKKIPAKY